MLWLGTALYQSHTCTHIIAVALGFCLYGLLKIKLWLAYCSKEWLLMSACLLFNSCLSFLLCFLCHSTWPVMTEKSLGKRPKALWGRWWEVMFAGMSLKPVNLHLFFPQDTPAIKEIPHSWALALHSCPTSSTQLHGANCPDFLRTPLPSFPVTFCSRRTNSCFAFRCYPLTVGSYFILLISC